MNECASCIKMTQELIVQRVAREGRAPAPCVQLTLQPCLLCNITQRSYQVLPRWWRWPELHWNVLGLVWAGQFVNIADEVVMRVASVASSTSYYLWMFTSYYLWMFHSTMIAKFSKVSPIRAKGILKMCETPFWLIRWSIHCSVWLTPPIHESTEWRCVMLPHSALLPWRLC